MSKKSSKNNNKQINVSNKTSQLSTNIKEIKPVSSISSKTAPKIVALSHEQIAERAKSIWMNRGCPTHQDDINWYEAENQLKKELGIH